MKKHTLLEVYNTLEQARAFAKAGEADIALKFIIKAKEQLQDVRQQIIKKM